MELNVNYLDTPSKLGSHGEDIVAEKKYAVEDKYVKQGKHGSVFFVKTPRAGTNLAVKRQQIRSPENYKDRAYRELRIFEALSKLNCTNFVSIVNWYKIRTEDEEEMAMHYIMECADKTLADAKNIPGHEFKEVLFQILYALNLAQSQIEFSHNDLHLRNILLSKIKYPITINHKEKTFHFKDWEVKICDYGLSRIKVDDEVIFNPVDIFSEIFDATSDCRKLSSELKGMKIEWANPEDKTLFADLKRKMTKGTNPGILLSHDLFQSLATVKKEEQSTTVATMPALEAEKKVEVKLEFEEDKENIENSITKSTSKLRISSKQPSIPRKRATKKV
jgi:serine/threonine protein kinase